MPTAAVCVSTVVLWALQDDAVKLVLRHPHLASSAHQLRALTALLQELPARLGIDLHQLQSLLVARPNLARYSSPDALVAKVEALSPLFPGACAVFARWTRWWQNVTTQSGKDRASKVC